MSANKGKKVPVQEQQSNNTLSSIVSNLVRAAIGGNHQDVPDQDLDKYVADMIMKSANTADKKYKTVGLDAYTGDGIDSKDKAKLASGTIIHREDSNGLKTNKRFLSSIIKSTDEHNQALIRAEEKRAADVARELIADLDKRKADRQQSFDRNWDRRRREDESGQRRMRMDEIEHVPSTGARPKSTLISRSRTRSRSSSPVSESRVITRGRGSRKYDNNSTSSPQDSSSGSRLGSKMDKYFQDGYDPLFDTHSADEDVCQRKTSKKSKKSRKDKEKDKNRRKRHKKHQSSDKHKEEKRSRGSASRKKIHHSSSDSYSDSLSDSDSDNTRDTKRKNRHRSLHNSSSSRRQSRHIDDSDTDGPERTKSSRERHKRNRSPSRSASRSPSQSRLKKRKDSHRREERHSRDKDPSKKRRRRRSSSASSCNSDNDSNDDESRKAKDADKRSRAQKNRQRGRSISADSSPHFALRSRSRSRSPQSAGPSLSKPAPREWDLHKINKSAIHAHLFGTNRNERQQ